MNHRFYTKSKKEQNRVHVVIGICSVSILCLFVSIAIASGVYSIGVVTFVLILSVIAPFYDVPSLQKSGKMIYYSSLFIAEQPKNGCIKVHGGTLFDYYFVIDRKMNGKQRTNFIIQQYLQGLVALIEKYESDKQMKIRGTSYIINDRTAEKMGFKIVKTDSIEKVILIYNYFNILISNSFAKNRLSFPKLSRTKTFEADISQLLARKEYIEKMNNMFKNAITQNE